MSKIVWVVFGVMVVTLVVFVGLYLFAGLREYIQAVSTIRSLPTKQIVRAEYKF